MIGPMSSLVRAVSPRDRRAAARTLVLVAVLGLVVNVAWELHALLAGVPTSGPAGVAATIGACVVLLALALACRRAPERFPPVVYAALSPIGIALHAGICLGSGDATASGQLGFIYVMVYVAAHFRGPFAWATALAALAGDAVVTLSLLPLEEAVGDLIVMAAALSMLTVVLVTAGSHQDRLVARLDAQARADPLTGLSTRRELADVAGRLLGDAGDRLAGRERVPRRPDRRTGGGPDAVALVLIDVDRFKDLNDTHGHPVGDAALVHVAQLVRSAVRPSDTVARLGGDELAVLIPASLDDALARAHAVHDAVRRTPLPLGGAEVPMTVSVGVAHARVGASTFAELYAAADTALYRAKVAGRDTVVAAAV